MGQNVVNANNLAGRGHRGPGLDGGKKRNKVESQTKVALFSFLFLLVYKVILLVVKD